MRNLMKAVLLTLLLAAGSLAAQDQPAVTSADNPLAVLKNEL